MVPGPFDAPALRPVAGRGAGGAEDDVYRCDGSTQPPSPHLAMTNPLAGRDP